MRATANTDFLTLVDRVVIFATGSLAVSGVTSTILHVYISRGALTTVLGVVQPMYIDPGSLASAEDDAGADLQRRAELAERINDDVAPGAGPRAPMKLRARSLGHVRR